MVGREEQSITVWDHDLNKGSGHEMEEGEKEYISNKINRKQRRPTCL
jgi:hypothetical protein